MSSAERNTIWSAVHDERRALVRDLADLSDERWAEPSLCPGWDVHDVVAHLVDSATTTRVGFARRLVAARFDFDRDNAAGISSERRESPAETLAALDRVASETKTPPAPLATRLVEAVVHGEDIRRPLGLRRDYPVDHVVPPLICQLRTPTSMGGGKERAAGFRLLADDSEVVAGMGPDVSGSSLALLLAISGRPVDSHELSGPGADAFRERLSSTG